MKDICNLCSAREFELVNTTLRDDKEHCKVYRCVKCNHIQLLARPTAEEDAEFYNKNLQDKSRNKRIDYAVLRTNNMFDTGRHSAFFTQRHINRQSRILDIGVGYGFFVHALYEQDYKDVMGIEISEERRALAQAHTPASIIDYDINKPAGDIGTFDAVTLFHVLEHMHDPILFLENIKPLLKRGAFLICEVPNTRELLLEVCPAYNDFYWIRAHLNYFSRDTLVDCFRRAGYGNVNIQFEQRYGLINLCNWFITGKPQIEHPIFEINNIYKPIEKFYRNFLEKRGKNDALIAIARG